jgi:hypothetical protein
MPRSLSGWLSLPLSLSPHAELPAGSVDAGVGRKSQKNATTPPMAAAVGGAGSSPHVAREESIDHFLIAQRFVSFRGDLALVVPLPW